MKDHRIRAMEDYIFEHRHVTLKELCDRFDVAINTVRRDVDILLRWGAVEKVYGGVVANPLYRSYLHYSERSYVHTNAKSTIGRLAAAQLAPDDIIMGDTGSTISEFFRHIRDDIPLTVISNNMTALALFTRSRLVKLISLGGEYVTSANGFTSAETLDSLKNYKANKAFISATGILAEDTGITNAATVENEIKRLMIQFSSTVFLLVDSSKFGHVSPVSIATFADIDYLITDQRPTQKFCQVLERHSVGLIVP